MKVNVQNESALIYLSDQAIRNEESGTFKKRTLGHHDVSLREKARFMKMTALNTVMLEACHEDKVVVDRDTLVIIIPIAGEVIYKASKVVRKIEVNESVAFSLAKGQAYHVFNPLRDHTVEYLELHFDLSVIKTITNSSFEVEKNVNQLIEVYSAEDVKVSIGMYEGRAEQSINYYQKSGGILGFVVQGAFEIQNRLVHAGDSLALWNMPEYSSIEFEALSRGAIVLVVEM